MRFFTYVSALLLFCCKPSGSENTPSLGASVTVTPRAPLVRKAPRAASTEVRRGSNEVRELRFAWRPTGGTSREYEMTDPRDQHQIILMPGVQRGNPKTVIALHGQPRRGQLPREYEFPRVVMELTRQLVQSREVMPLVLLIPRFRFDGQNWPAFALDAFLARANEVLQNEGFVLSQPYVFGHSGAAGCGGLGLNSAVTVNPRAVAFFDTCLGSGFIKSVAELRGNRIPVLLLHSVETAGYRPRQRTEYLSSFDFGKVYKTLGLLPIPCPESVPDVPLRQLDYRCAADSSHNARAFVVDTGEGETAHNAVVPVGLRYFLKNYVGKL